MKEAEPHIPRFDFTRHFPIDQAADHEQLPNGIPFLVGATAPQEQLANEISFTSGTAPLMQVLQIVASMSANACGKPLKFNNVYVQKIRKDFCCKLVFLFLLFYRTVHHFRF